MTVKGGGVEARGSAAAHGFEELDDRGVFITDDRLIVRAGITAGGRVRQGVRGHRGRRSSSCSRPRGARTGRPLSRRALG